VADIDLINWTLQAAENLNTERREASDPDGKASLDEIPSASEREAVEDASPDAPFAQLANALSIQLAAESQVDTTSSEVVTLSEPDIVLPASPPLAPAAGHRVDAQMSNLLKAIVEPDINTARADRDRAISLRWVLRDIKSNRLNWSPVTQYDLRILIIMGLVEMHNDAPVLTNAGANAIA
jgi:hypothetical protein